MRMTMLVSVLAMLALSADEARACGHRCGCRRGHFRAVVAQPYSYAPIAYNPQPTTYVVAQPYSYAPIAYNPQPTTYVEAPVPAPAASPADPAVVRASLATPGAEVQPLYNYDARPENGVAYYYTYDESGNLVIKQWMDWLFRGGRRAGLPAPPLPLIGRINN